MRSENIQMMCSNLRCRSILNVPTHARGKVVRCSRCGSRVKVPSQKSGDAGETHSAAAGTH